MNSGVVVQIEEKTEKQRQRCGSKLNYLKNKKCSQKTSSDIVTTIRRRYSQDFVRIKNNITRSRSVRHERPQKLIVFNSPQKYQRKMNVEMTVALRIEI